MNKKALLHPTLCTYMVRLARALYAHDEEDQRLLTDRFCGPKLMQGTVFILGAPPALQLQDESFDEVGLTKAIATAYGKTSSMTGKLREEQVS